MGRPRASRLLTAIAALGLAPLLAAPAWAQSNDKLRSSYYTAMDAEMNRLPGPLLFSHRVGSRLEWGVRPLVSMVSDGARREFDLLYPMLTHRSGPAGSHGQLFQFTRWSSRVGAGPVTEWMIFPLVAYQSATPMSGTGFALFPVHGTLRNFFSQDRLRFTLFPLWLSLDRRGVTSRFVLWPFFGWYAGQPGAEHPAHGWKIWPLYGTFVHEGVKESRFVLWPFYFHQRRDLDTERPVEQRMLLPFYFSTHSPEKSTAWWGFWPLTVGHTVNRSTHHEEWSVLWPLIQFGHGDDKSISSAFPFYRAWSRTRTAGIFGPGRTHSSTSSRIILWPIYRQTSDIGPNSRRDRTRLLLFLYSDLTERSTRTEPAESSDAPPMPRAARRIDLWPLFTYNATADGAVAFQTLALVEALLNTEGIKRNYSPLWSIAAHRRDPDGSRGTSLLWGLIQWGRSEQERSVRLFYLPRIRWGRSPSPHITEQTDAPAPETSPPGTSSIDTPSFDEPPAPAPDDQSH